MNAIKVVTHATLAVVALCPLAGHAAEKQLSCEVTVFTGEFAGDLTAFGGKRIWRVAFDEAENSARMVEFVPVNLPPVHANGDAVNITPDSVSFCLADAGCDNVDIDRVTINRRTGAFRWVYNIEHTDTVLAQLTQGTCKPYVEPKQQF
ncbi:hypothetical protein [Lysobacter sp. HA18]